MDNFIATIKNKLMLPANKEDTVRKSSTLIPMPDIDNMSAAAPHPELPAQDVSQVQKEPEKSPDKVPSKSGFGGLLNSFTSKDKKAEEEPKYEPNPIEDDIFIYYD